MSTQDVASRPAGRGSQQALLAITAAILLVAGGWAVGRLSAPMSSGPSEGSSEAGFARDMQAHHLQAVEMSMMIRDRAQDPEIRQLAYDVARTQQHQAGQMYGWLSVWDLPQASPQPAMARMEGSAGHSTSHATTQDAPAMSGMATSAELEALEEAEGLEAERLYLELMIPHHKAGVTMAEAALAETDYPAVRSLAQSIVASQQPEIRYLEQLLSTR